MSATVVVSDQEDTKFQIKLLDLKDTSSNCCGKSNAGRHYAVESCCLGCKTFFRRAVIQKRRYFCDNGYNCDPRERKSRGPCAACRLNRCYLAGMTKEALRGRRDIIAPKGMKRESSASESGDEVTKKRFQFRGPVAMHRHVSDSGMEIETIRQLTILDKALRERKMQRFYSLAEARKLSCMILNKTDVPFLYFTELRIVDVVELACLTSLELYNLIEWVQTLSFYPKMTVAHRAEALRRYAIYQIVIETGYCTAKSNYDNVWVMPNGTCMPLSVENLPLESQKIVTAERKWRQEHLYRKMTKNCIDVGQEFRRLNILPEELAMLKIILFCECSKNDQASKEAIKMLEDFKSSLFNNLFSFYRQTNTENYEERFANLILDISQLVSTAASIHESYQIMRVFKIVPFDKFTESLLFNLDP
ncbi:Nuclear hormone receptor family member nhr-19 [Aphelenchoides bicaudatus]|nr:Nuclear hormone receptor family member nhr-19 [Aphelenchoides bicaudatus]